MPDRPSAVSNDLDLADLRALQRFAALGSLAAAGDALDLTPSAMGRRIARLEAALGSPLLDRRHRPPRLTRAGETAVAYADRLLGLNDEMVATLKADGADGTVRLGVPHDIAELVVPAGLARFRETHPGIAVALQTGTTPHLLGDLAAGRLDLCLTTERHPPPTSTVLARLKLVWLGADASLADRHPVPLVLSGPSCTFRPVILEALNRSGRPWRAVAEIPSVGATIAMVRAGYGVAALLDRAAPTDLVRLRETTGSAIAGPETTGPETSGKGGLPPLPHFAVALHRRRHPDRAVAALADTLVATPLAAGVGVGPTGD